MLRPFFVGVVIAGEQIREEKQFQYEEHDEKFDEYDGP
jgi:hypothetical protein